VTEENKYVEVTLQNYFDNPIGIEAVKKFQFESWVEQDKKRREYWASPEGKAQLERENKIREERWKREAKFAKRWQWLHNLLVDHGCQCEDNGCC
jgi:hypothetical protein